jgi:hypothetical protein
MILKTLKKAVAVSDASISMRTLSSRGNLQASLTYPHRHDRFGQVASKQPLCFDTIAPASRDRGYTATAHSPLIAHDGSLPGAHRNSDCWQRLVASGLKWAAVQMLRRRRRVS